MRLSYLQLKSHYIICNVTLTANKTKDIFWYYIFNSPALFFEFIFDYNSKQINFYFFGKLYLPESCFLLPLMLLFFINLASVENVFFHLSSFCCGHEMGSPIELLLT